MKVKWNTQYLNNLNTFYIVLVLLILTVACTKPKYYYEELALQDKELPVTNSTKAIYVLTDQGCFACNLQFNTKVLQEMDNLDNLFVINAKSNSMDLSKFKKNVPNILFNYKKDTLFQSSKIIYMNNLKVDSIVYINVKTKTIKDIIK